MTLPPDFLLAAASDFLFAGSGSMDLRGWFSLVCLAGSLMLTFLGVLAGRVAVLLGVLKLEKVKFIRVVDIILGTKGTPEWAGLWKSATLVVAGLLSGYKNNMETSHK